jgi:hypothetical protein
MSGAGTSRTVRTVRSPQMNLSVSSCVRTSAGLWLSRYAAPAGCDGQTGRDRYRAGPNRSTGVLGAVAAGVPLPGAPGNHLGRLIGPEPAGRGGHLPVAADGQHMISHLVPAQAHLSRKGVGSAVSALSSSAWEHCGNKEASTRVNWSQDRPNWSRPDMPGEAYVGGVRRFPKPCVIA